MILLFFVLFMTSDLPQCNIRFEYNVVARIETSESANQSAEKC